MNRRLPARRSPRFVRLLARSSCADDRVRRAADEQHGRTNQRYGDYGTPLQGRKKGEEHRHNRRDDQEQYNEDACNRRWWFDGPHGVSSYWTRRRYAVGGCFSRAFTTLPG